MPAFAPLQLMYAAITSIALGLLTFGAPSGHFLGGPPVENVGPLAHASHGPHTSSSWFCWGGGFHGGK